ncbi:hypothetical protein AVEN_138780-1 [Araneus ventricosus]|uniref:Uncharacterized protein n=1 Tax=Araneus ventricosus TaxID=182803 RepID=A0A4Y2FS35_ARAVE|nr:hypothetical protein AVEN_138780-1 [Araneus ventricosus]
MRVFPKRYLLSGHASYINFEAVLLGQWTAKLIAASSAWKKGIILAQFEFKSLKGFLFIFENAHRDPTNFSDPRSIRVHIELTICNLRFDVNNSDLNWDTGQFNKMMKFTDIQNTTDL